MITSGPRRKKDGSARRLDSFPRWRRSLSFPPSSPPPPPPPLATSLDLRWEGFSGSRVLRPFVVVLILGDGGCSVS